MKIQENFSIKDFNTFGVDVKAKYFVEVKDIDELMKCLQKFKGERVFFLGGGSNTLFVNDFDGLIVKVDFKGIEVKSEDMDFVYVNAKAGEVWEDFVNFCVERNYGGVENMSMVPGSFGGAVSQNIGAYGQGILDSLFEIFVFDIEKKKEIVLKPEDCGFEYRNSKFKNEWLGKYLVVSATLKLKKNCESFEMSYHERAGRYGSIVDELKLFTKEPYTLKDLKVAVERQREKRLPSLDDFGTCGSFFKNPIVNEEKAKQLEKEIDGLQIYPDEYGNVKIPAGRILEELGWKGKWEGPVGVFERHALCVVTNKKASGKQILDFVEKMKSSVRDAYGIELVEEVNIVF